MSRIPAHPVSVDGRRYSPEFQHEAQFARGWASVLRKAYEQHLPLHCHCGTRGERLLYVRLVDDTYQVARYPDSGPEHEPDCIYFRPANDDAEDGVSPEPPLTRHENVSRFRLRQVFPMDAHPSPARPRRQAKGPRTGGSEVPLIALRALLEELWRQAGLFEWKPQWAGSRSLFRLAYRLQESAKRLEVNGRSLNEALLVGAVRGDYNSGQRNVQICVRAQQCRSRLLVVARLAAPKDDNVQLDTLRLANFNGIPWVMISDTVRRDIYLNEPEAITHWRAGHPTMVMALIEPPALGHQGRSWQATAVALMPTNQNYVPMLAV